MASIDEIKARRDAATENWEITREEDSYPDDHYLGRGLMFPESIGPLTVEHDGTDEQIEADAAFVSNAREDIGFLLAELAAERGNPGQLKEALIECRQALCAAVYVDMEPGEREELCLPTLKKTGVLLDEKGSGAGGVCGCKPPTPGECRRCSECMGEEHHWLDDFTEDGQPIFACKHCPATKPWESDLGGS